MHYKHQNSFFGYVKKIQILGWTPYPNSFRELIIDTYVEFREC